MIENVTERTDQLLDFYRDQYPEIEFEICYNYMDLYLNLLIKYKEGIWSGSMPIDDITPSRVNFVVTEFLARNQIKK